MKLVRFEDSAVDGMAIDFHPQITVIRGLPRSARLRIIETAEAIPAGDNSVSNATIEAHGVRMSLNAENLALLELAHHLDVVIAPTDLPAGATEADTAIDQELAAARDRSRSADLDYERVLKSIGDLRRQKERLIEERLLLTRQIEAARSNLDNFAEAGLREARDELEALDRMAAGIRAEEADRSSRVERARELDDEISALDRELTGTVNADPTQVRSAYSALNVALQPLVIPSADAQRLAEEIAVARRRQALSPELATAENNIERAVARRSRAREGLVRAERESRSPTLDPRLVEQLENNRDELFAIVQQRRTGPRTKKRQSMLEARESELLQQLGFESWSAYLLDQSGFGEQRKPQHGLNAARMEVAEAERELAAAVSARANHPTLREYQAHVDELVLRAHRMLGHDGRGDLIGALSAHTNTVAADPQSVRDATESLAAELAKVGVRAEATSAAAVGLAARTWLEGREDIPRRAAQLRTRIDTLRSERHGLGARPGGHPTAVGVRPDLALSPTRAEAADRLVDQEARLERHRAALVRLSEFRAREELLAGHEQDTERKLDNAQRLAGVAAQARQSAHVVQSKIEAELSQRGTSVSNAPVDDPVAAVEWYVLARLAQQRAVSYAGSVPLVIDDAFEGWDFEDVERVHDRLERMSEAVQVIYFSESERVTQWARSKGPGKAVVIDLSPAGPEGSPTH
jgi:hypothetical protein